MIPQILIIILTLWGIINYFRDKTQTQQDDTFSIIGGMAFCQFLYWWGGFYDGMPLVGFDVTYLPQALFLLLSVAEIVWAFAHVGETRLKATPMTFFWTAVSFGLLGWGGFWDVFLK